MINRQGAKIAGIGNREFTNSHRYIFDAGKAAPILLYDAYRPIKSGSRAEIASVLINGWGGYVKTVFPVFAQALAARAGSEEKAPYVIAPQFPQRETMARNGEPDDGRAVWGDSWAHENRHPNQMGPVPESVSVGEAYVQPSPPVETASSSRVPVIVTPVGRRWPPRTARR